MLRRLRKRIKARLYLLRMYVRSVVYEPLFVWFIRRLYVPFLYDTHLKYWPAMSAIRRVLRRKTKPVPCCRRDGFRGPRYHLAGAVPTLTATNCRQCGRRHLQLEVGPGSLGVTVNG